ncbi:LOW QUALITY PROTEIN: acyl-CoA dehydrogenase family member 11-like [Phaethornis superciliosus]
MKCRRSLRVPFACRLPWWASSATCKLWKSGHFLPCVWEMCQALSPKGMDMMAGHRQQVSMQEKQLLEDLEIPLVRRETKTLFQEQPETGNQYVEDVLLRSYLKTHLPPKILEEVNQDLERFGNHLLTEIKPQGWECELNPPVDAWGQQGDHILTCSAWSRIREISADEGLIAEAYQRRYSNWSCLCQAVKLHLFSSFSAGFNCPLAMTDGAAKVTESLGIPGSLKNAFEHLTTRDPKKFWTSGQWMGSDVANGTETMGRPGTDHLCGFKWFTSAADSDVALTLARVAGAEGHVKQGSGGLSLLFLKVQDEEGKLNNIQVQRLKDKLSTQQMATAELWLEGAPAELKNLELASSPGKLEAAVEQRQEALSSLTGFTPAAGSRQAVTMELAARDFYTLARTYAGALLTDHAAQPDASSADISAAQSSDERDPKFKPSLSPCQSWDKPFAFFVQELGLVATEFQHGSFEMEKVLLDRTLVYGDSPACCGSL